MKSSATRLDGVSRIRRLQAACLGALLLLGLSPDARALDYTWTSGSNELWDSTTAWDSASPGTFPSSASDNVVATTGGGDIFVDKAFTINNFTFTTISSPNIRALNSGSVSASLTMNTLTKEVAGTHVFRGDTLSRTLALTINTVDQSTGIINFGMINGQADNRRSLVSLQINDAINISGGTINFNVASDYSIGQLNFSAGTAKTINLIYIDADVTSGITRAITTTGINNEPGVGGAINGVSSDATAGINTATLIIDTAADSSHTSLSLFSDADGAGSGTLALVKQGEGTQELARAGGSPYSGGTTIVAGTLLVSNTGNSGLGSGAVTVTGGVLGGTGVIAPDNNDISFEAGTLAVGGIGDTDGSGIVTFEFRREGGAVNLVLESDVEVRLDIWSTDDYERLVFGGGSNALTSIELANATLIIDSPFSGWAVGQSFQVFDWGGVTPDSLFGELVLPDLGPGLLWDAGDLYTSGVLTVVPEPGSNALLLLTGAVLLGASLRHIGRKRHANGEAPMFRNPRT